jgi:hypothetical protein
VIISILPINTRPGAVSDRWKIIQTAQKIGLHLQTIEPGAMRYQTPILEEASLTSTGLDLKSNWRSRDLAIFRKIHEPKSEIIEQILASIAGTDKQEWTEVLFGRYKVKLRGPYDEYLTPPELISIEKGDVLPTVSRRYPGRRFVDLWLWDNRVFGVKGKAAILDALHIMAGRPNLSVTSSVSNMNHNRAVELLSQVLGLSRQLTRLKDKKAAPKYHHASIKRGEPDAKSSSCMR